MFDFQLCLYGETKIHLRGFMIKRSRDVYSAHSEDFSCCNLPGDATSVKGCCKSFSVTSLIGVWNHNIFQTAGKIVYHSRFSSVC